MIDRAVIEKIAIACRRGLSSLYGTRGSAFADFPRGACGPASEIVGRLLKEQLHYDGVYVCGCEHPGLPADQSHAWFEVADVLIDITYDQFDGIGLSGWTFARDSGWHGQFTSIERRDGFCIPSGWPCYPYDGYQAALDSLSVT
ncbi:hypothetical protein SBC1_80950 (plasmid) [Caballeronia sp. SBC1]|uniref:hypothetical protein n=1 Tax=Caballeronia sp. SBC1 TaxID=2705548 RepID=UPI00140B86F5|nr:hypothetical protein [Caballeronia sp. SBC1]QIN68048.1 hypothetical protein SBC1_80950 [Caballeronia sp. SBC1]